MVRNDEEVLGLLQILIRDETGASHPHLTPDTRLGRDLGIDGADGTDLMRRFAEEFKVDLTNFRASDYFGPEASFNPFAMLSPTWWRRRRALKDLCIEDLIVAARSGRWPAQASE